MSVINANANANAAIKYRDNFNSVKPETITARITNDNRNVTGINNSETNALNAATLSISDQGQKLSQTKHVNSSLTAIGQTADGSLSRTSDLLQKMKDLVIASDSNMADDDKKYVQDEINKLKEQMDNVTQNTTYAGTKLLDGNFSINNSGVELKIGDMRTSALGSESTKIADINVVSGDAKKNLDAIYQAIDTISKQRTDIGRAESGFASKIEQPSASIDKNNPFQARISDSDMASSTMDKLKKEMLLNPQKAVLAQANVTPQSILNLFR